MNIFSKLFSTDTEKKSQIRKWVTQEIEQVNMDNPDDYALFITLMHAASQWGKLGSTETSNQIDQVGKQYLGDATIFEIACYTYFCLESWLTKNQPKFKDDLVLPIGKWIVEKFSLTFYLNEYQVNKVFTEIINQYQAITSAEQNVEHVYLELEQRIIRTKGNKFNQKKSPKESSKVVLDFQYIKHNIAQYEECYITAVIEKVQEYCTKHSKKQINQETNIPQNQEQKDYLYGMALVAQKDWVRACKALTKVIAANSNHYDAFVQRGLLHIALHQPVDAVQDFTRAIEIKPNEPAAYIYRGRCYHRNFRQKDKSLADYSAAIRLAPKAPAGYFGRGELYDDIAFCDEKQALEDKDHAKYTDVSEEVLAAIEDYSQTILLEPTHDNAYVNRALIYARKARANKNIDFAKNAIADFEQAINLNWEHGYLYKQQDEMKELVEQEK